MKFGIDIGHNCPPDTGCMGIVLEDKLTREVGVLVKEMLIELKHEVVDCTPTKATTVNHSLQQRATKANVAEVGLFVSIHFNCFNREANGTEVYAASPIGKAYAESVLKEICKLGFVNRGVKSGAKYSVIKNTEAPAILIECCFCDSEKDMDILDVVKMAEAIVRGLV